jgi:hypothetical protein
LVQEASATARLDEVYVEPEDLLLLEYDSLDGLLSQDLWRASQGLVILRGVARRRPRRLFTARRLMAAARLRLNDRGEERGATPAWLEDHLGDAEERRKSLEAALEPRALAGLSEEPAIVGAAIFLARWHATGAADSIGGILGRALAAAWLRRTGLTRYPVLLLALGFVGRADAYRPDDGGAWIGRFAEAASRGTELGIGLLRRLTEAERRLGEVARPRRGTSRLPMLVGHLLAEPATNASSAAAACGVSATAARMLLQELARLGAIRELTGRKSFRLYGV